MFRIVIACALALLGAGFGAAAWAGLGQPASSAAADGTLMPELHALHATAAGQVQQTTVETVGGVMVHEFSAGGPVFAITWSGSSLPDLGQLFGSYFSAYRAAAAGRSAAAYRAPMHARGSELVAHTSGHMGAYAGSAYVPALVPAGVDLAALGVQP